ncbi:hypothetical protein R1flu_014675 [Riccia fluitans]|uniref:Uncharacterized protein n=1 Tax=Riccia fluitans TaxID=41844 RepID=A0ABD1YGR6_9MARC
MACELTLEAQSVRSRHSALDRSSYLWRRSRINSVGSFLTRGRRVYRLRVTNSPRNARIRNSFRRTPGGWPSSRQQVQLDSSLAKGQVKGEISRVDCLRDQGLLVLRTFLCGKTPPTH